MQAHALRHVQRCVEARLPWWRASQALEECRLERGGRPQPHLREHDIPRVESVVDRAGGRSHRPRDRPDGGARGPVSGDDPARRRQDLILVELRNPRHRVIEY